MRQQVKLISQEQYENRLDEEKNSSSGLSTSQLSRFVCKAKQRLSGIAKLAVVLHS
tara:strand:- start:155437 stop:155604 length:168 start_codon:yes stop_codon:yes gene_type:complete